MIAALGRPTALRARLMAVVIVALVAALTLTTAGFNILLANRLDHTADDVLRSRVQSELGEIQVRGGRLVAPAAGDDAAAIDEPVWVFEGGRAIERPRASAALNRAAAALARGSARTTDLGDDEARLLAQPVVAGGRRVGTLVAVVSLTPYRRTRDVALVGSLGVAVALLLAGILATRWLLTAGLRPVVRMTGQAALWSERDLDRRFGLGPPTDELSQLAATLDGLLGRLAAGMRREQRFSAELSHELRTPLARMNAQAQLALAEDLPTDQRDAWSAVLRSSAEMAQTLDALLAGARADASSQPGVADARAVADAVAERHAPLAAEHGVRIDVRAPVAPLRAGAEAQLLERLLAPLVDNACRYAATEVVIAVGGAGASVVYEVSDDGPGVAEDERERIFEPAVRGSAGTALRSGTGLGLALARRLADAAGGSVEALEPEGDGARFAVSVPRV
jgi:signal transduction histidine kinase